MLKMSLLIERSKCWRYCWSKCWRYWWWSKYQSAEDVAADQKVKVLKMLMKMLLIERSKCRSCCWSKGQSAEDVVADRKFKVVNILLLIERSKWCWWYYQSRSQNVAVVEDWRWRLFDVEKLPMIYRCVTLMMLIISSPTIVVVDVVVEYPSR